MAESTQAISSVSAASEHGFVRAIGLFDGTMIVVGSMIGSGIFIVAADISRQTGSPGGLLLTWIIHPISLGSKYAISLSVQQLVGILMILFITFLNTLGVRLGKLIQNIFTSAKTLSLMGLVLLGIFVGRNAGAITENFSHLWALHNPQTLEPGANFLKSLVPTVSASSGAFGLFVAFGVAQVGSLFSADAWNNIGFTAAEVKNPKRDVALSMALGTIIVITLYCLANLD